MQSQFDRRLFLSTTAGATLAGMLPDLPAWAQQPPTDSSSSCIALSENALRELKQKFGVKKLLQPKVADFNEIAMPKNSRYRNNRPGAIALCENTADVQAAINICRENKVSFVARSGGHSYAGFSTTCGLLIDVSRINHTRFDRDKKLLTIGGGTTNKELMAVLEKHNRVLTHGRCSSVGAAAFFLGGGIGFNMRQLGVGCDQMVETEIVTADGRARRVSETTDPDHLFWACRGGGGGNFGINTEFVLQTYPVPIVSGFILEWQNVAEGTVLQLMADLDNKEPDKLGLRVALRGKSDGIVDIEVRGQLIQVNKTNSIEEELKIIFGPKYNEATNKWFFPSEKFSYFQCQEALSMSVPLFQQKPLTTGPNAGNSSKRQSYEADPSYLPYEILDLNDLNLNDSERICYQERSGYFPAGIPPEQLKIPPNKLQAAYQKLKMAPRISGPNGIVFFQTGGRINTLQAKDTAFVHRNNNWLMTIVIHWKVGEEKIVDGENIVETALKWQNSLYEIMESSTTGAYQNFPDPSLSGYMKAYYGVNQDMLKKVKKKFDPNGLFNFPQAIK